MTITSPFAVGDRVVVRVPTYCGVSRSNYAHGVYTHTTDAAVAGDVGVIKGAVDSQGDHRVAIERTGDVEHLHYASLTAAPVAPEHPRTEAARTARSILGSAASTADVIALAKFLLHE